MSQGNTYRIVVGRVYNLPHRVSGEISLEGISKLVRPVGSIRVSMTLGSKECPVIECCEDCNIKGITSPMSYLDLNIDTSFPSFHLLKYDVFISCNGTIGHKSDNEYFVDVNVPP